MKPEHLAFIETAISSHKDAVFQDPQSGTRGTPAIVYTLSGKQRTMCPIFTDGNISPMDGLKTVVKKTNADVYVFCSEAWLKMVDFKKKDYQKQVDRIEKNGVRNEKDKKECLVFSYGVIDGDKGMRQFWIERAKDTKRIIGLKQIVPMDTQFESTKTP